MAVLSQCLVLRYDLFINLYLHVKEKRALYVPSSTKGVGDRDKIRIPVFKKSVAMMDTGMVPVTRAHSAH